MLLASISSVKINILFRLMHFAMFSQHKLYRHIESGSNPMTVTSQVILAMERSFAFVNDE